jgi:hypothetical protein
VGLEPAVSGDITCNPLFSCFYKHTQ